MPKNAVGGQHRHQQHGDRAQPHITGMTGTYQVCSEGILGKFAKQLDVQMDDGNTATGSMRTVVDTAAIGDRGARDHGDRSRRADHATRSA